MKKKCLIFICIILIILISWTNIIPVSANDSNNANVYSEDGYIQYITLDTKALDPSRPTWGNTGFVIRLDYVTSCNPLKDKKYAIIRFNDEGVDKKVDDLGDGKKRSTYTITEKALRKALRNSKYGNLEEEFDELIEKNKPIYLNGIFQVYHGGVKYGPEIFTYNGGYDSNGKYRKGIYTAEGWRDPTTFGQYFNIKVQYEPGTHPVSIEYRTQYNELLYSKDLEKVKTGTEVKAPTFQKTYKKNGYTYELYRSYYINLSSPNETKGNKKLSKGDSIEAVSKRTAKVKSGGLKFVAMYKLKGEELEEVPADEKEVEFEEPEPTAVIKADQRGSEQFNVSDGIPTTEDLYVNVFTTDYLVSYRFIKKVGIKKVPVNVEKTYTLKWDKEIKEKDPDTGEDVITYEPQSSTETVNVTVDLERAYGYWRIEQLDVFALTSAEVMNNAFPGDCITINAEGVTLPEITYKVDKALDQHVFLPKDIKDKYVLPAAEIIGTTSKPDIPEEDLSAYVNGEVGELIVQNDKLVYNGKTIMTDEQTEKEGIAPDNIEQGKMITENTLYKYNITIPREKANDYYQSKGTVKYTSGIHIGKTSTINEIVYDIGGINDVVVHTPTVCNAQLTDLKPYNQRVIPEKTRASLILDKTFQIYLPTTGNHNDYLGYGTRDYGKYMAGREVKFPFDVYCGTQYIAANTWVNISADTTAYYLPTWVAEGNYTIEFRAPAINSEANNTNSEMYANYTLSNYVAIDTIDVNVSGRIYNLQIYDITDYPTWQDVFRNKNSLTLTGNTYTVGTNDQNGLFTGRLEKYTFPLVNGSHPTYETIGAVKLGYGTRFKFTTIGDLYNNDQVKIVPRFYYVDAKGQNRQEVDLYYTETYENQRNYLVKVGSARDKRNMKIGTLGSKYWQVPDIEIAATCYATGKTMKEVRAQQEKLFSFGGITISSAFRTFCGTSNYTPTKTIPSTVDPKIVIQSVQTWYGEYYLPSEVHVLPKGYDLEKYFITHDRVDFTEDMWLKNGYIIVNFEIITYQEGKEEGHLSYINKENALAGYCNMWDLEGAPLRKVDVEGNVFEFKYGDYLLYYTERSAAKDYRSGGTH
ncbi:DUF5704 domain-containing protein [Anaerosporobacter faecicola]|uniref:DUF5704 domain-containing protein n=1 Tax=Anaerosporobacter faecicola TaxID=2718714 RepID=UPI0014398B2A|nr:DUF5704 domain-containing protein [Anaerosporobacter faecicola]